MTIISAQDIEQISLFGEVFERAMDAPATSNDPQQRLADAEAIIGNIIAHAHSITDNTADNVGVAMNTVCAVLGKAISSIEDLGLPCPEHKISDLKRTVLSFDPN